MKVCGQLHDPATLPPAEKPRVPHVNLYTWRRGRCVAPATNQTKFLSCAACRIMPIPNELSHFWYGCTMLNKTKLCRLFLHQKQKNIILLNYTRHTKKGHENNELCKGKVFPAHTMHIQGVQV
jgi:hypothetical protein